MKIVKYSINWGGYIGAEDEFEIEVEDDATQEEIEEAVQEDYDMQLSDNCYWEIIGVGKED